jgi:hypothetical protein
MKKIKYLLLLILLIIIPKPVFAATCNTAELNKLKVSAISSEVSYNYIDNNKFEIIFDNLNSDFYIEDMKSGVKVAYSKDVTTKILKNFIGGRAYSFNFFGATKSKCPHVLLRVQYLTLPKFNPYSLREECKGVEEFELCNKWYPGTFTEKEFTERVAAYKIEKEKEEDNPDDNDNPPQEEVKKTLWDNIMDYLNQEYVLALVGVAVLGIILIIILKIFKRR